MDQKTAVGVSVVAGFAAGIFVGRLTAPKPKPAPTFLLDCTTLQNRTIRVSGNGALDCPVAAIGSFHQVTWVGPVDIKLRITFTEGNPFPKSREGVNTYDSGPVGSNVFAPGDPEGTKKSFPYSVSLNGVPGQNGRIIIQKQK